LAREAGLTERYVSKVFRCAFLAPDIVEAILAGRQPQDLNFDKLCQNVPLSWAEQREQLGFSPSYTRRPRPFLVQEILVSEVLLQQQDSLHGSLITKSDSLIRP
jgi:hypothetical protein